MISEPSGRIVTHVFPGGSGRWEVRRRSFREGGRPSELLVISDLSRALREEERQAWQRLVRVIGHELNSSLAPIKSMAGTLRKLIRREPAPPDWRDDANSGLTIIHDRAESLERFMGAYARLARLPPPARRDTDFAALVGRVASLQAGSGDDRRRASRPAVDRPGSNRAGADQSTSQRRRGGGRARRRACRWRIEEDRLVVEVVDDGPGLARTDNLWVPFFTTKPGGTGIGLVLSREIVENHGGAITLENRTGASGCIARVSLPLGATRRLAVRSANGY